LKSKNIAELAVIFKNILGWESVALGDEFDEKQSTKNF
jgi:hypothetical protein